MSVESIIAEINSEIGRLQQAKLLLSGDIVVKKGPGRPRTSAASPKPTEKSRRTLSAAARAKIAAAQKARWAKTKKAAGKTATKTEPAK